MQLKPQLKISISILFLLITTKSPSQTTGDYQYLDERNGFKSFTFGDSKQKYDGMIDDKLKSMTIFMNTNVSTYQYINSEPSELFGAKWKELNLGFIRNKLTHIRVDWKFSRGKFLALKDDLAKIFGEPEDWHTKLTNNYVWRGNKILMQLSTISDLWIAEAGLDGDETISLTIENKALRSYLLYDKKKDF